MMADRPRAHRDPPATGSRWTPRSLPRKLVAALWLVLIGLSPAVGVAQTPTSDVEALVGSLRTSTLVFGDAVSVSDLRLDAGPGVIHMHIGVLVPASPVRGAVREFVFVGQGSVHLPPADALEAQQLELFTGREEVREEIISGVLVVADDPAAQGLLQRESVDPLSTSLRQQASELWSTWRGSGERRLLQIESVLVADALGDRLVSGYFSGWFESTSLGKFLYVFDPSAYEQTVVGQFVTVESSEKERRKIGRKIAKQQRRGRLLGLEAEDLGRWDTWSSAALRRDGRVHYGGSPADMLHYVIDVSVAPRSLELEATARLTFQSRIGGARWLPLELQGDLRVTAAREASGAELAFLQQGDQLSVFLSEPTERGAEISIEVDYSGVLVEEVERARILTEPLGWYPRAEVTDRATFDVTVRWPDRYDLLGCGRVVDRGASKKQRWERRLIDRPVLGFTFEIGRLETITTDAGGTPVTLGLDPLSKSLIEPETRQQILETLAESLLYYEEVFGPYPFDELVAISSPRAFSQSLPGFITLSTAAISDNVWLRLLRGNDGRAVVAHEVAHQWWGHVIGWSGYRDQWLSEALAQWSALAFARHHLGSRAAGPLLGWKRSLQATTKDGRPVESIGPIVMGVRLDSSRSPQAYSAIVYNKGAVVMDTLAKSFGDENYLRVLAALVEGLDGHDLTTEDFLSAVERITGTNLEAFAKQYILGTGMPEVLYDYSVERTDGGWSIVGKAEQVAAFRMRYRAVEAGGAYLLARERIDLLDVSNSHLTVPVQIGVLDPSKAVTSAQKETGNVVLVTTLQLTGAETPIELDLEHEPKQLWLDGLSEALATFVNGKSQPKEASYHRALQLAASGEASRAEPEFFRALSIDSASGPNLRGDTASEKEALLWGLRTDSRIHYSLCRLYLDQGAVEQAEDALELGNDFDRRADKASLRIVRRPASAEVLEARIALRRGRLERAYDLLNRVVRKKRRIANQEALLALAIAARATGRDQVFAEALELAEAKGADVSALAALASN